jgi:hypothetical protein
MRRFCLRTALSDSVKIALKYFLGVSILALKESLSLIAKSVLTKLRINLLDPPQDAAFEVPAGKSF